MEKTVVLKMLPSQNSKITFKQNLVSIRAMYVNYFAQFALRYPLIHKRIFVHYLTSFFLPIVCAFKDTVATHGLTSMANVAVLILSKNIPKGKATSVENARLFAMP